MMLEELMTKSIITSPANDNTKKPLKNYHINDLAEIDRIKSITISSYLMGDLRDHDTSLGSIILTV